MTLWLKHFFTYACFLLAIVAVGVFGLTIAYDLGSAFHKVNMETVPLLGYLKDLRFAGLRIVSSSTEYMYLMNTTKVTRASLNEEKAYIQLGREQYHKALDLCSRAMTWSDEDRQNFRKIEHAGAKLLRLSHLMTSNAEKHVALGQLDTKEEFENAEKLFLDAVAYAHDRALEKLNKDEKEAFANIAKKKNSMIFLLAGLCLFSLCVAYLLSSQFSRRIILLQKAAEKVAGGDLTQNVEVNSADEIGNLSESFNTMVESLRNTQNKLISAHTYLDGIYSSVPDIIIIIDKHALIADCNRSLTNLLGFKKEALLGSSIVSLFAKPEKAREMIEEIKLRRKIVGREIELCTGAGESIPFSISLSTLHSNDDSDNLIILVAHNIAKRKEDEQKMLELAYNDYLTGLPNRKLFFDRCDQAIAAAKRRNTRLSLLFLDLDHFKDVNDTLGHHFGDLLLQAMSERLSKIIRSSDTFARLGGDEFALLCTSTSTPQHAEIIAKKILALLDKPFIIEDKEIFTSASIGIVIFPEDGSSSSMLLKNADLAMYSAKGQGRKSFNFFSDEMNLKAQERSTIEDGLRHAMESDQILLHYQPQIDLQTGKIFGVEALCRWLHPELGYIAPDRFIPVAEQTGMIRPLGEFVLNTACRQCAEWHKQGFPLSVAVNVSIAQLLHPDFPNKVAAALQHTDLSPEYLELEITESLLMDSAEKSINILSQLKSIGVKIAIDDFGTGYSSLSYLNKLSLDRIKIDKSFVREIIARDDATAIVRAIIAIGHSLGLKVIAEGVETEDEQNILSHLACDEAQGYFYARPMAASDVWQFITAHFLFKESA